VGFCTTIIERLRDAASAGSVFWPCGFSAATGAVLGIVLMVVLRAALIRTPLPGWIVRWATLHPGAFSVIAFLFALELAALFENVRHFGVAAARLVKRFMA
jgi:hypothetical protein